MAPLTILSLLALVLNPPPSPDPETVREAVSRAIPKVQASLAEYARKQTCFSCHHQGLGLVALSAARGRGLAIDDDLYRAQIQFTQAALASGAERYRQGRGQGNGATGAGYAVWALERAGQPADEVTDAVVHYLLTQGQDAWRATCRRPPAEGSPFTSTFVALVALRRSRSPDREAAIAQRIDRVRDWLLNTPAEDTESRVFRLRALRIAEASPEAVQSAGSNLRERQTAEGGWAQVPGRPPDPYATGSVLAALIATGEGHIDDPSYRRGVAYLLKTQEIDGTWHVSTHSRPFQAYFESGFPHGPDQFLSVSATSWAILALLPWLPPIKPVQKVQGDGLRSLLRDFEPTVVP